MCDLEEIMYMESCMAARNRLLPFFHKPIKYIMLLVCGAFNVSEGFFEKMFVLVLTCTYEYFEHFVCLFLVFFSVLCLNVSVYIHTGHKKTVGNMNYFVYVCKL